MIINFSIRPLPIKRWPPLHIGASARIWKRIAFPLCTVIDDKWLFKIAGEKGHISDNLGATPAILWSYQTNMWHIWIQASRNSPDMPDMSGEFWKCPVNFENVRRRPPRSPDKMSSKGNMNFCPPVIPSVKMSESLKCPASHNMFSRSLRIHISVPQSREIMH